MTHATLEGDRLAYEEAGLRVNLRVVVQPHAITLSEPTGMISLAVTRHEGTRRDGDIAGTDMSLRAPMPGLVVETPVALGASVTKGQTVIVIEAMKLMQSLTAPCDGTLIALPHGAGASVEADAVLATIEPVMTAPAEKTDV